MTCEHNRSVGLDLYEGKKWCYDCRASLPLAPGEKQSHQLNVVRAAMRDTQKVLEDA